ncbi:unnamed protein product [Prunus brigantina]
MDVGPTKTSWPEGKSRLTCSPRGRMTSACDKKTFNHHECWEMVKNCKHFRIIPTGPPVMLNETPLPNKATITILTPLHDSMTSDSPLDSLVSQDSPIEKEPRPISRKAAKAKKGSNSSTNTSKSLEKIAR